MTTITNSKQVYNISLMSWGAVKAFLIANGLHPQTANFSFHINVEKTGRWDQLTGANTFVTTADVEKYLEGGPKKLFRQMECEVTTHLDDQRYYLPLNQTSIGSIID